MARSSERRLTRDDRSNQGPSTAHGAKDAAGMLRLRHAAKSHRARRSEFKRRGDAACGEHRRTRRREGPSGGGSRRAEDAQRAQARMGETRVSQPVGGQRGSGIHGDHFGQSPGGFVFNGRLFGWQRQHGQLTTARTVAGVMSRRRAGHGGVRGVMSPNHHIIAAAGLDRLLRAGPAEQHRQHGQRQLPPEDARYCSPGIPHVCACQKRCDAKLRRCARTIVPEYTPGRAGSATRNRAALLRNSQKSWLRAADPADFPMSSAGWPGNVAIR